MLPPISAKPPRRSAMPSRPKQRPLDGMSVARGPQQSTHRQNDVKCADGGHDETRSGFQPGARARGTSERTDDPSRDQYQHNGNRSVGERGAGRYPQAGDRAGRLAEEIRKNDCLAMSRGQRMDETKRHGDGHADREAISRTEEFQDMSGKDTLKIALRGKDRFEDFWHRMALDLRATCNLCWECQRRNYTSRLAIQNGTVSKLPDGCSRRDSVKASFSIGRLLCNQSRS